MKQPSIDPQQQFEEPSNGAPGLSAADAGASTTLGDGARALDVSHNETVGDTHTPESSAPGAPLWALLPMLVGAIGLIGLAQHSFHEESAYTWGGLAYAFLAVLTFGLVAQAATGKLTHPLWGKVTGRLTRVSYRGIAIAIAVALSIAHLQLLALTPPLPNYNWTVLLWVGALALYFFGITKPGAFTRRAPTKATPWWKTERRLVFAVAAVLIVALGLRAWQLETIPQTLGGDEAEQGLEAIDVMRGAINNPFSTGWLGVPTMSFYVYVPTIALLGNTVTALRLPWALIGTATVLTTFLLVRRLKGTLLALMTAVLLAGYHFHIHYSRLGSNQIADPLFVSLALLLFYRGYDTGNRMTWALSGIVIGASQYFYAGARLTAVLIIALLVYFTIVDRKRFWREHYQGALIMIGAALLAGAPMIQFAFRFPNDYNARLNQVGIFQNGWFERAPEYYDKAPVMILIEQFLRAALAFNAYADQTVWYGSPRPLFDFADGALFLLGLGYASLCVLNRRLMPMVLWWWGGMMMGGFLTENPPSTQRIVTLTVPAVFFVAFALHQIGLILLNVWRHASARTIIAQSTGVVALALALMSVRWYFVDFTPLMAYGGGNGMVATAIAKYARDQLGPDWRMYFFGPPRMYIGLASIPYLAPDVEGMDVLNPLTAPPGPGTFLDDKHAAFIFLPERFAELDLVRRTFPNGELLEYPSPLGGEPIYFLYRVPRDKMTR
jgi:hypothetical protein